MGSSHYPTIDFFKGLGIIFVLALHAGNPFPLFNLALPLLVVCMGTTGYLSFLRWKNIKHYISGKIVRFLPAWGLMFPIAAYVNGGAAGYGLIYYAFLFLLPISGPGNYFLGIITQSIIVIPILCWFYQKNPLGTVGVAMFIQVAHYLALGAGWFPSATDPAFEEMLITGYMFTLMIGIVIGNLISRDVVIPMLQIWPINESGLASYHIFLVQIVYFCLPVSSIPAIVSVVFCMSTGWLFMKANDWINHIGWYNPLSGHKEQRTG